ncbi:MAG: YigZ family protein [Clostridiales bacterium]|nr:YigZ family protein [Clostridiales bacterium]
MIELIEKKSKFYGYSYNVTSAKQVEAILLDLKKEHKKSTHICYAYNIKSDVVLAKACDDGEPSGTAGRPIFNVIDKKNISNILVVVVRYFGGVKLGAGGLVRAYTKCASMAVEEFLCK